MNHIELKGTHRQAGQQLGTLLWEQSVDYGTASVCHHIRTDGICRGVHPYLSNLLS